MSTEYEAGEDLSADDVAAAAAIDARLGDEPDEKPQFTPTPEYDHEAAVEAAEAEKAKQAEPESDNEKLARAMGWSPKEDWRGPEDKWVSADDFVERARPGQLLERISKMEKDHQRQVENMERMNQAALERQRTELKAERDWRIAEAVKAGDVKEVNRVNEAYQVANERLSEPSVDPAVETQKAQADWGKMDAFRSNKAFGAAAWAICEQNKEKPLKEQLEIVDRELADAFPDIYAPKAEAKPVNAPPASARQMDGVRVSGGRKTNYVAKLPASAKAQGERFVKQGLFKNIEEYAKEYVND